MKDGGWGDFFGPIIVGALGIALIISCLVGAVGVPSYYSDRAECRYAHESAAVETKFVKHHLLSWDCYVKVNNQWVPFDKWRGADDGN